METLAFEPLSTIAHVHVDENDSRKISYLCMYPRLGLLYCHMLQVFSNTGEAIGCWCGFHSPSVLARQIKDRIDATRFLTAIDDLRAWQAE